MKNSLIFSIISVIIVMTSCSPRIIIQISDPQLGFIDESKGFEPEEELMNMITPEVNRIRPDMVLFTGDLIHHTGNADELEGFRKMCSMFDKRIPLCYTPGNHDIGNEAGKEEIDRFIERYGYDRFVYKGKGYVVIGFNSCIIKTGSQSEQEQFEWMEQQIRKAGNKTVIVAGHHPFFTKSPDEDEFYFNIAPELRKKYLEMFERHGVDLVLAGHLHERAYGEYNGIPFVTAGAAGRAFNDGSGISVIRIEKGKATVQWHTVESFPVVLE